MNKRGHMVFALLMGIIAIYLLNDLNIIKIDYKVLLLHLPAYLFGAILVDKIERPTSRWHRGLLHSRRMFILSLFIIAPFLIYKTLNSPFSEIMEAKYNYFSLALAITLSHLTHLFGDSLTSRLPR